MIALRNRNRRDESMSVKSVRMVAEVNIRNHNPVALRPLWYVLAELKKSGEKKAMIYLSERAWKSADKSEGGWFCWNSGGLFIDPMGDYFWLDELDAHDIPARLLQPGEIYEVRISQK